MRILVCVKQICHIYGRSGSNAASSFLDDKDKIYRVNPYDESAMELALRIKDSFKETEVIMLTLGPIIAETELRRCFALGADDLYQIESEEIRDTWKKSNILAQAAKELKSDLIFCGKESADQQNWQVGAFMAHHLRLPFVSAIMDISVPEDTG